jgi:hypothetical protein
MRKLRFNIASLLLVVLVAGVGFAALRESNEIWASGVFTITLGVLLISIVLATHRREKRRAFWLGFAVFGAGYLALSLIPSIESRLLTRKALDYLDSKVSRSIPVGVGMAYFEYDDDGKTDLYVANNPQRNALSLNNANGTIQDLTAIAGLSSAGNQGAVNDGSVYRVVTAVEKSYLKRLAGRWLGRSGGTTENFIRIGHSLLALIIAFLGGQLSRKWFDREHRIRSGAVPSQLG